MMKIGIYCLSSVILIKNNKLFAYQATFNYLLTINDIRHKVTCNNNNNDTGTNPFQPGCMTYP